MKKNVSLSRTKKFSTKLTYLLVGFLFLLSQILYSQTYDTINLRKIVNNLNTLESQKLFWEEVYYTDQKAASGKMHEEFNIDSLNDINLILVSMYINKYGYPSKSKHGNKSMIGSIVWVHNKYHAIRKLTFPIILEGYKRKEISEYRFRDYFLRVLYQFNYNDREYKDSSLIQLFVKLDLELTNKINIHELIFKLDSIKNFEDNLILELGRWTELVNSDTSYYNGKQMISYYGGSTYVLKKHVLGKVYIGKPGLSMEFREIEYIDLNLFKLKHRQTERYFKLTEDGNLIEFLGRNRKTIYYKI